MDYQETLEKIEMVMKITGIREYCTQKCKGDCCTQRCYESEKSCHNESRRLACSIFLCSSMIKRFKEPARSFFYNANYYIYSALQNVSFEDKNHGGRSIYSYPYTKDMIERFKVDSHTINEFVTAALKQSKSLRNRLKNMKRGRRPNSKR